MQLSKVFESLGLRDEQSKIYSTLLERGSMRVVEIAKYSKLPRTSCYEYLPALIELDLVKEKIEGKSRLFEASSPRLLLDLLYERKNEINFNLSNFESNFDNFLKHYDARNAPDKMRFSEGKNEILELLDSVNPKSKVIYSLNSAVDFERKIINFLKKSENYFDLVEQSFGAKLAFIKVIDKNRLIIIDAIAYLAYEICDENVVKFEEMMFANSKQ